MKKKKLTNGEKRECRLRYLYRQLKRVGKIKKDTPMKACRGELEKKISLQEKSPRKKRISGNPSPPSKKARRKTRKWLRSKLTQAMQVAKKARRERRKTYNEKKRTKGKVPSIKNIKNANEIPKLPNKFSGRPKVNVDLV